jgi:hypothetical protein
VDFEIVRVLFERCDGLMPISRKDIPGRPCEALIDLVGGLVLAHLMRQSIESQMVLTLTHGAW